MAVRRETVKRQFAEFLTNGNLEPGERLVAGVLTQSGPTPWLTGAIGIVFMLLLGMRWYFLAVTDRRLIGVRASLWSTRPTAVEWSAPLGSGALSDVDADAKLWSHLKFQRPGEAKAVRYHVHRIWRDDLREVLAAMRAPTPPAAGSVPPPPPPPEGPLLP